MQAHVGVGVAVVVEVAVKVGVEVGVKVGVEVEVGVGVTLVGYHRMILSHTGSCSVLMHPLA